MRRRGFTLVELLVTMGIIAVLAGIVLSVALRGRGGANKVICANNLHQLSMAMITYAQDNDGRFPSDAVLSPPPQPAGARYPAEDWVYWREDDKGVLKSPVFKYIKSTDVNALVCPADSREMRLRGTQPVYRFSYSMSNYFSATGPIILDPTGRPYPRLRQTAVKYPNRKLLVLEEDEITLDDGSFRFDRLGRPEESMLGTRHDKRRKDPHTWRNNGASTRKDRGDKGNVAFADGHVDYIARRDTWDPMFYDPRMAE